MTAHLQECLRIIQETIDLAADVQDGVIRFVDYDEMGAPEYVEMTADEAYDYIEDIRGGP